MWSEQTNRARETAKKKRSTCWKTAGDFVIRSWNLPFLHHFVHTTVKSVNASHNYMLQSTITYNKMIRYSQLTNPLNTCRLQHTCLEASTDPEDLDQQDRHWLLINIMLKRITIDSLQYLFTSTTVQWQPLILCWNESLTRVHTDFTLFQWLVIVVIFVSLLSSSFYLIAFSTDRSEIKDVIWYFYLKKKMFNVFPVKIK